MSDSIDLADDDASEPALDGPDPANGLLTAVVYRLMPLFVMPGFDAGYAPRAAAEAIESFAPQSRSEIANIGRILALTLASVDTIAQAVTLDISAGERLRFLTKGQGLSASADRTERVMVLRRKQALAARAADTADAPPEQQPARPGPQRYRPLSPDDPGFAPPPVGEHGFAPPPVAEHGSAPPPVAEHGAAVTTAPAPHANAQMTAPPPRAAVTAALPPVAQPAAPFGPRAVPPAVAMPHAGASSFGIGASIGLPDPVGLEAMMQQALAGGVQERDLDALLAGLRTLTGESGLLAGIPGGRGGSLRDSRPGRDARPPPADYTGNPTG